MARVEKTTNIREGTRGEKETRSIIPLLAGAVSANWQEILVGKAVPKDHERAVY